VQACRAGNTSADGLVSYPGLLWREIGDALQMSRRLLTLRTPKAIGSLIRSASRRPHNAGWISGVHLSDLGRVTPKVYDGREARKHEDRAVVAHIRLPADKLALVEIVNLFEPEEGDVLHFDETRFEVGECSVNGERVRLSDYITSRGLEHGRQPLIGDFAGAKVNVSLQSVDTSQGRVHLYAPVFPGVDYRFAKPQPDYAEHFRSEIARRDTSGAAWSCNCILNFVFGELEGKRIGGLSGPITFGEIGYQLLNQTMVTLRVV